jgi:cytoskeletal protein RodZ
MLNTLDDNELKKKKILRYSLLIGIITIIIIIIVVVVVFVVKSKKKDDSENSENERTNPQSSEPSWDNLVPTPSEQKMQELIQSSFNITTAMTQSEIQEILSDNLYQIIRFTKGIYNLEIENENKIYGLKFSRKKYVILDEGVIFNVIGEPFKKYTD